MVRLTLFATVLLASHPGTALARDTESLMAAYRTKTQVIRRCDRSGDAIVVCGESQAERNARERLPLPREEADSNAPMRGDTPRASAAPVKQGSCGVSGGQGAGCVGGLSVLKAADMIGKSITAIVDPDADLAPPPPLPDRFKGTGQR
ncbi:hypothetical protein [Sphingobium sp. D43FB]|uniref:hypothetical protein n=1 Tax=Sphingobium sp. D43FB TaxID=2017595 RepID=UPI000BB59EBE|nr:hypothetical protein [Sphingobium sp. D43FB]PBN45085.1 hypothetical protein SxD43FB_02550 [Sphingobium sp. D43FB]